MHHSADFADRRAGGVYVYVRCASTDCLDDLFKVHEWSYALAVGTYHVGHSNRASHCSSGGIGAGCHSWIGGWGWTIWGLAQKHHDAASFLRQTKVNMRLGNWSIQIVVSERVAEGASIRAKSGMEGTCGLCCNWTGSLVDASKSRGEGIVIVIRGCAHDSETENGQNNQT